MKTRGLLALSSLVAALLVHTPTTFGQAPLIIVTNATTTNVSGITYATLNCTFPAHCYTLMSTNVGHVDTTNLSAILNLYRPGGIICLCDFEPLSCPGMDEQDETLVLGALEPGDYTLRVWGPDSSFGGPPTLTAVIPFTVSNAIPSTPMLSLSPTNSGLLKLDVNGVSGATYVIQSSTDFTNWTSIWTNHGAPFWATLDGGTNDSCYFRTQIVSGP